MKIGLIKSRVALRGAKTGLILACIVLTFCTPACKDQWTVKRVIDGDTVVVERRGVEQKVRFKGMDAPEIPHPDYGQFRNDPFGYESRQCLVDILDGRPVRLVSALASGAPEHDDYGRLLAYVYDGDTLVNAELIRRGCARAFNRYPHPRQQEFNELEARARAQGLGLWSK